MASAAPTLGNDLGTSAVQALPQERDGVPAATQAPFSGSHPKALRAVHQIGGGRVFERRPARMRRHDDAHARWSEVHPLVRRLPGAALLDTEPAS